MPNTPKGGPGQNPRNGGVGGPGSEPAQGVREGVETAGNRLKEGFAAAKDGAMSGYKKAEGAIAANPAQSILIGFGVGFGIGLILTQLIGREEESWSERNITGPLKKKYPQAAKQGERYWDAASEAAKKVPGQFQHLADEAKNVPDYVHQMADAVVSRLPHSIRKHFS